MGVSAIPRVIEKIARELARKGLPSHATDQMIDNHWPAYIRDAEKIFMERLSHAADSPG